MSYPCTNADAYFNGQVYPNPFKDHFTVVCPELQANETTEWALYDAAGKLYQSGSFTGQRLAVRIRQNLAAGLYIVKLKGRVTGAVKVVKG